jgi:hypothetical protein
LHRTSSTPETRYLAGRISRFVAVLLSALVGTVSLASSPVASAHTDPINSDPQVKQSAQEFNNLEFDDALKLREKVAAEHPTDPMAWNYVLTTIVFRELYHQDLLDTTYYAHDSFLTSKRQIDVAPGTRSQIEELTNKVLALSDAAIKANPADANAYFARSYGKGIHAVFLTLVDHSFAAAARQGSAARNDSEQALKIDPQYADARMAIGIQQFAVASLPRWVRLVVGFMGVGGNKAQGLENLRKSIAHGVVTPVQSRTVLSLFLRHDGQYPAALDVETGLANQFPHNYLFRLEVANLLKDEGQGLKAIATYEQVIADAQKPGYFTDPELQMAWFGLADTQRGYNDVRSAAYGYTQAAMQPKCSDWLKKRAELDAGEMDDLLSDRKDALHMYQLASASGGDQTQADAARKYLQTPFTGK